MTYVIAASRPGYEQSVRRLALRLKSRVVLIQRREDLTAAKLLELKPRMIFFPHWSFYIPKEIFTAHECIVFHMTDLPFGRGGSPLQNLIVRGLRKTKLSALRVVEHLDAGPIYMKRPLSLEGTAQEILSRAAQLIEQMILQLATRHVHPRPQTGQVTVFERRKPEDGNIAVVQEVRQVYDYIRMLDAEGYPRAFIRINGWRLEFDQATQKKGKVIARVEITKESN